MNEPLEDTSDDPYDDFLKELARLASVVAAGDGTAETRRRLVKVLGIVEGIRTEEEKDAAWHALFEELGREPTREEIAERMDIPVSEVPEMGHRRILSPVERRSVVLELSDDVVGFYGGSESDYPYFFSLLPGGLYLSSSAFIDGHILEAGHWRVTATAVELEGFEQVFDDFPVPPHPVRADVEFKPEGMPKQLPRDAVSPQLIRTWHALFEELMREPTPREIAERMDIPVSKVRKVRWWLDAVGQTRRARQFIREARDWMDQAKEESRRRLVRLVPTTLTDAEARHVDGLVRGAQELVRQGLIEEPLRLYATILARHPSHAPQYVEAVDDLLRTLIWRRCTAGDEEILFLARRFMFLSALSAAGHEFHVEVGDWLQRGTEVALFGTQRQRLLDWAKAGSAPDGFEPILPTAVPAYLRAGLVLPPLQVSEFESEGFIEKMVAIWNYNSRGPEREREP